ncbi:Fimbrial protein MS11-D3a (fragment) [Neisseria gonorrhoeae]
MGMTGFNDAAGNEKIDTKHLPSTCRDAASAGCIETPPTAFYKIPKPSFPRTYIPSFPRKWESRT